MKQPGSASVQRAIANAKNVGFMEVLETPRLGPPALSSRAPHMTREGWRYPPLLPASPPSSLPSLPDELEQFPFQERKDNG